MSNADDAREIEAAFRKIHDAVLKITEVLGRNDELNDNVPTNWPLQFSGDEFAALCWAMVEHYRELANPRAADRD